MEAKCENKLILTLLTVYPGMVIGESSKSQDMYLNPTVKKQLTNIRAAGADDKVRSSFLSLGLPVTDLEPHRSSSHHRAPCRWKKT
jgi:hypothetical protein